MSRKSKLTLADAVITVQPKDDDGLTGFTEYLNMWADKALSLATLTDDEKAELTFTRDQLNFYVAELKRRVGVLDKHFVGRVMEAAFLIGCDAVRSPIVERIRREASDSGAAHARESKLAKRPDINTIILDCAYLIWKKKPNARNSPGKTAAAIISEVVNRLGGIQNSPIKTANAVERRLRKMMKTGPLARHPD